MNPSITVFDSSVFDFINKEFSIDTLSNDCLFTEGPVWNKEGFYLFSDTQANLIYKQRPGHKKEVYLVNSGTANTNDPDLKPDQTGSNGLAYTVDGSLLICQHGNHAIAKYDGSVMHNFIAGFQNRPFNSPNDLIVHKDGRIYFSDPPYGLKNGQLNKEKFQPVAGVYCWEKEDVRLICDTYQYPNGVCLSPGHDQLYICSSKPFEKFISVYDVATHQLIKIVAEENSDGIECDQAGNIYLSTKEGIVILNKEGHRLALVSLPSIPANHCWGGDGGKDLFITARENIFLIRDFLR